MKQAESSTQRMETNGKEESDPGNRENDQQWNTRHPSAQPPTAGSPFSNDVDTGQSVVPPGRVNAERALEWLRVLPRGPWTLSFHRKSRMIADG